MDKKIIGIDLGGTTVKFAILTSEGEIQQKWSIDTNILDEGSHIVPEIVASINHRLELYGLQPEAFIGIGMGTPGSVDRDKGTVIGAYNLNWKTLQPVKELIEKGTKIPFAIDNDANVAALGERWKGAGDNNPDVIFITLGTGVGGGIVLNGEVLNGCHSSGGEIGHIPIRSYEQRLCGCGGRNCLETFASANGLALSMRKKLVEVNETWREITPPMVFEKAAQKNVHAQAVLAEFVDILGQALAGIMNTIDVEEIVIGGGLSEAGEQLLLPLTEKLEEYVFPQIKAHFSVKKAQLGNEAGIYGAVYAYLIKNKIV